MTAPIRTVAVGMSGGVDSSLAALLLKKAGYAVIGITMAIYSGDDSCSDSTGHACYGPGETDDINAAKAVSNFLSIPHYTIDLREEYKKTILDYFTSEYLQGRTPNPCTRCNPLMKFGFLVEKAKASGINFDMFATGHYAQIYHDESKACYTLKKAKDSKKDQSYFLYGIQKNCLSQLLFPLGTLTKKEVRFYANDADLPVSERPESQDFIECGDYTYLFKPEDIKPGPILDPSGKFLGVHRGIIYYTTGQRRGLGISHSEPLYVLEIDGAANTITVGPREHLYSKKLTAGNLNFVSIARPVQPLRIFAKLRQNHIPAAAEMLVCDNDKAQVIFDSPQLAITPGQAVVFYEDDILLGGGIIEKRDKTI